MPAPTDADLDRLLAEGGVPGAKRDQLFEAVLDATEPSNSANAATEPTPEATPHPLADWWKKLWRPLAIATPVAAALVIGVVYSSAPASEFQARSEAPEGPHLLASCGAIDAPCTVGKPLFLRLVSPVDVGPVKVVLVGSNRETAVATLSKLTAHQKQPLNVKITPEDTDVPAGLTFEVKEPNGKVFSTLKVHVVKATR